MITSDCIRLQFTGYESITELVFCTRSISELNIVPGTLCNVYYVVYDVQFALYTVHWRRTVYNIYSTLHCTVYTLVYYVQRIVYDYTVHCIMYMYTVFDIHCTSCTVYIYSVYSVQWKVYCTAYTVRRIINVHPWNKVRSRVVEEMNL